MNAIEANDSPAPWCKIGDYVIFPKHAGQTIEVKRNDGQDPDQYLLVNDDEIRAVVKDPSQIKSVFVSIESLWNLMKKPATTFQRRGEPSELEELIQPDLVPANSNRSCSSSSG